MKKRKLDIAVLSDIHLGTNECHADELIAYLNSIQPNILILNGDIMDVWGFETPYFPSTHLKVLKKIMGLASNGTEVYYITGNKDDAIRKISDTTAGNFKIVDKLILEFNGKRALFFHGDIFDISLPFMGVFMNLGSYGYPLIFLLNRSINWLRKRLGWEKYSLSKKIKKDTRSAEKHIRKFEEATVNMALDGGYDYVICGHTHHPKKELHERKNGSCTYLNSGDWVENLTSLEYALKRWKIYHYHNDKLSSFFADEDIKEMNIQELIASITINKKVKKKGKSTD